MEFLSSGSPALLVDTPMGMMQGPGHWLELFCDVYMLHVWSHTSISKDERVP